MRVDASGDTSILPVVLKPGWHYCHYCEHNTPPRAYHCHDCRACILRQDHHCKFTGCCIGHHNQRFFVAAVLHLLLGLSYMLAFQWPLVYQQIGVSFYFFPLVLLAPHFAWAWGAISHWGMVIATVHCAGIAAWIVCVYVMYKQLCVVVTGATQYEAKHDIETYNVSLSYNVKMALGDRWYLVALWPHVVSVLPSDGLQFAIAGQHEEIKDM
ncbi:Palmitoyltransferase DHHC domain [Trinorchestia longiramus]|nr:Palmitoyltransferase DHHC domain [Trinorchestia longiramus]